MNKIKTAQRQAAHEVVVAALTRSNGNVADVGRILGISQKAAAQWVRRLNLSPGDYKIPDYSHSYQGAIIMARKREKNPEPRKAITADYYWAVRYMDVEVHTSKMGKMSIRVDYDVEEREWPI